MSAHYLPPYAYVDAYVDADPSLVDERAAALQRRGLQPIVEPTWTVPTPYRSTAAEVELMAREGVAVVECEVASLLAVAEALGVSAGACLYVPGSLTNPAEEPGRDQRTPAVMFNATLEALGLPSQTKATRLPPSSGSSGSAEILAALEGTNLRRPASQGRARRIRFRVRRCE